MHILWDSNPEAPREIKNWLVRLTKAESQAKLLGLQIKMLAWIKCLVKILKLSFPLHLVGYLLTHHVNAGKSLTWCGTVQPPMSWLFFGTLFNFSEAVASKLSVVGWILNIQSAEVIIVTLMTDIHSSLLLLFQHPEKSNVGLA